MVRHVSLVSFVHVGLIRLPSHHCSGGNIFIYSARYIYDISGNLARIYSMMGLNFMGGSKFLQFNYYELSINRLGLFCVKHVLCGFPVFLPQSKHVGHRCECDLERLSMLAL